jgi:hypothetical protein
MSLPSGRGFLLSEAVLRGATIGDGSRGRTVLLFCAGLAVRRGRSMSFEADGLGHASAPPAW